MIIELQNADKIIYSNVTLEDLDRAVKCLSIELKGETLERKVEGEEINIYSHGGELEISYNTVEQELTFY